MIELIISFVYCLLGYISTRTGACLTFFFGYKELLGRLTQFRASMRAIAEDSARMVGYSEVFFGGSEVDSDA